MGSGGLQDCSLEKTDILKGIELSTIRKMKSTETLFFLPLKVPVHLICLDNFSPKVRNKLEKKSTKYC